MKTLPHLSAGLSCAVSLLTSTVVLAESTSKNLKADVLVTATRTEQRADETLADITVISRDQLDLYAGQTLIDVLSKEGGLQISRNGGAGGLSSVFVRGANSTHTLLLVDGVRLSDAFFGRPLNEEVPLESIERIEILRGPASALYGSDAIGGVVQIFTRRAPHTWSRATVGSNRHAALAVGTSGAKDTLSWAVNASRTTEHTFSATRPGNFLSAADDDPFRLAAYNARVEWAFDPKWSVRLNHLRSVGRTHVDQGDVTDAMGAFVASVDTRMRTRTDSGSVTLAGTVRDGWKTRFTVSESRYKAALEMTPFGDEQNNSAQTQVAWQNDVSTDLGIVTLGAEHQRQTIDALATVYPVRLRENDALFAWLNGSSGAHTWQGQVRTDDFDTAGRRNTALAAYGYALTEALRLRASHGTSYRVPALIDLYFPGFSNPDLKPERGRSSEAGIDYRVGAHQLKASAFRNRVEDLIQINSTFTGLENIAAATLSGLTLSDQYRAGAWRILGRLDWLDTEDAATGKRLPRRSKEQASLNIDYLQDAWTLGGRLFAQGQRFDRAGEQNALGGYALLDLSASRRLSPEWTASVQLNNVFDRTYETAAFFNQPGRRVFVTLAWSQRP